MDLIALAGPQLAGKTTLAHALAERGYLLINFTGLLKQIAVASLSEAGHRVSVEEMLQNKAKYRRYLQELGELIGFDTDPAFVHEAVEKAGWYTRRAPRKAVFDNVRTVEQIRTLAEYGFELVYLDTPEHVRFGRAARIHGLSREEFDRQHTHPIEDGSRLRELAAAVLDYAPVEHLVWEVESLEAARI